VVAFNTNEVILTHAFEPEAETNERHPNQRTDDDENNGEQEPDLWIGNNWTDNQKQGGQQSQHR